ncbi:MULTISPECIES: enoyl-CoA hydratase-related protein [Vibrio]|uniref:Gamma-carboxygeranoyl-CoA hydratase n=3 Tax=Vibrio TaxID=662 RepID=A0A0A5HTN9_PHOS4|nr:MULTISPECIES: enoyl-CoA hydratase-related protein [Vibrio]KGY06854.1 gamma-carboxygeranoyl-CoA hydratase [Vibrio sinaloensis]KHD25717.1 gamma-carboxygeranoyl-CoA hydratase [Vibrio caribbeanicus]KIE21330.1 gamma-carboxygeranoyl-CoA hydratase [Vibrio sinaloensis]
MDITLSSDLQYEIDQNGVATLSLNRLDKHNAFGDQLIHELILALDYLANHPDVRCLLLKGNGEHFSAGADLNWMKQMAEQSHEANVEDAQTLAKLMSILDQFPHPTIVYVHGWAFGGALGLICCSDIAIADHHARFCLSEVKLGLVPATIAPYVIRSIGVRQARRYMLTAETIDAKTAQELHIVHHLTSKDDAQACIDRFIAQILRNSPAALRHAKELIEHCDNKIIDRELVRYTSDMIANVRVSRQGQEGLAAFIEKRPPIWPDEE